MVIELLTHYLPLYFALLDILFLSHKLFRHLITYPFSNSEVAVRLIPKIRQESNREI